MNEWWREAAWLMLPDGTAYVNPQTRVERVESGVRLHAHKLRNYFVTLPPDHPLAIAATGGE